ncbi:MAG: GNAT family N-acetyltransferase [Clostridium sp.]
MNIEFRQPTKEDGINISIWRYDGIYNFYNNDKTKAKQDWAKNIASEENTFVIYNNNELIANCCFEYEKDDKAYSNKFYIGVQMKPELTGKGMGYDIVTKIIAFGKEKYKFNELFLIVAKFNKRAIKLYKKLGFTITDEFMLHANGEDTDFIEMKKDL